MLWQWGTQVSLVPCRSLPQPNSDVSALRASPSCVAFDGLARTTQRSPVYCKPGGPCKLGCNGIAS